MRSTPLHVLLLAAGLAAAAHARAPGYPSRDAKLDALPGFGTPPPGYGEVAFYWWQGDPLAKERLTWQLDRLQGRGVTSLQVNYAHSEVLVYNTLANFYRTIPARYRGDAASGMPGPVTLEIRYE